MSERRRARVSGMRATGPSHLGHLEGARGWLTVGFDREPSMLFVQSDVVEHAELATDPTRVDRG